MRDAPGKVGGAQIRRASKARLRILNPGKFLKWKATLLVFFFTNLMRKITWRKTKYWTLGYRLRYFIAFGSLSNNLKMCIGFDPIILLLRIHLREIIKNVCD